MSPMASGRVPEGRAGLQLPNLSMSLSVLPGPVGVKDPRAHSEVVPGIRVRSPADATNPAWPGTAVRVSRPPVKWTKLEANVVELNPVSHRPPLPSLARSGEELCVPSCRTFVQADPFQCSSQSPGGGGDPPPGVAAGISSTQALAGPCPRMATGTHACPLTGASPGRLIERHDRPFQCMAMMTCGVLFTVAPDCPRAQMSLAAAGLTSPGVPGTVTCRQVEPLNRSTHAGPNPSPDPGFAPNSHTSVRLNTAVPRTWFVLESLNLVHAEPSQRNA